MWSVIVTVLHFGWDDNLGEFNSITSDMGKAGGRRYDQEEGL